MKLRITCWPVGSSFIICTAIIAFLLSLPLVSGYVEGFEDGLGSGWDLEGNLQWQLDDIDPHSGSRSLKLGDIECTGTSTVLRKFGGSGEVGFWWRKSPVSGSSGKATVFTFSVDGHVQKTCDSLAWQRESYYIAEPGEHELRWDFRKVSCYPKSTGAGWIDDVETFESVVSPESRIPMEGYLSWSGPWDSRTEYEALDIVTYNGSSYVCVEKHSGYEPPNEVYWDLLASKGDKGDSGPDGDGLSWSGPWDSRTEYKALDIVTYNGSSYVCVEKHSGYEPPNEVYWDLLASKGDKGDSGPGGDGLSWKGPWDNKTEYVTLDVVTHNGSSYVCVENNTYLEPPNSSYWTPLSQKFEVPELQRDFYFVGPDDDLQSIILNSSNKTIYLKNGEYGPIEIDNSVYNLTLKSLNKWNAVLNASNGDFVVELNNASNISISDLVFIHGTNGLSIKQSTGCIIEDNLILDFEDVGIYLCESHVNTLSYNKISSLGPNSCGMWLDASHGNKIIENNINVQTYIIDSHNSSCDNYIFNINNGQVREKDIPCRIEVDGYVCENFINCDPVVGCKYDCYSKLRGEYRFKGLNISDHSCNRWS